MRAPTRPWVPDFCRLQTLFAVVIAAELVVLVLALAPLRHDAFDPLAFGAGSLLAQWIGLTSALLLCKLRAGLSRLPIVVGALLAWSIPVLVSLVGAALLLQIDIGLGDMLGGSRAHPWPFMSSVGMLAGLIGAAALRYAYVTEQWRQQVHAQAKSEVDALQARIRPHFLFNSMNTIASLVRRDPQAAERAIEDLSDLFRAALGAGEGESTLEEEVALVERFLAIERLRLGDRLQVNWRRDEPLPWTLPLPRLILQPLVENAVIHGIAQLAEGGTIDIGLRAERRVLSVEIGNPCPLDSMLSTGNAHAQQSIAQRLRYRFDNAASLVSRRDAGYYVCTLRLPIE
jgi:two-component system sensor histidine kinase AlgZ